MRSNTQKAWLRAALLGLAFLFLLPLATQAADSQAIMSDAIKSLLRQTNAMYLSKLNSSVDKLVNSDPRTFASALGVTMQRQGYYADQNPQYKTQYWTLRHECYGLLAQVARAKNNTNPQDGTSMTAETLKEEFLIGLRGKANSFFIQKLGINPANADLPMILAEVSLPKSDGTENHPRLPVRQDPDAIVLAGQKLEAAVDHEPKPIKRGGVVYVSNKVCPDRSDAKHVRIDSNNNPDDDVCVECSYFDDGRLQSQYPKVGGVTHGVVYYYALYDGVYFLEMVSHQTMGKREGVEENYRLTNGRPYLLDRSHYADGKWHGIVEHYDLHKGNPFLRQRMECVNGERHGVTEFYKVSKSGHVYRAAVVHLFKNKRHGERRVWDANGQLKTVAQYVNGKLVKETTRDWRTGKMKTTTY